MGIYKSVEELIGNTPLMELCGIEKALGLNAKIYAKLEYFNPAGSVKDRVAREILNDAEEKGILNSETVVIEPTSGNTGIGIAAIAAARGLKVKIVMPDTMSIERRKIIAAYGAEIVLSDGKKGMAGAIELAERMHAEIKNSFIAGQFVNKANPTAHIKTTGPEIWADLDGCVDCFVAGAGTGGTVTGNGKYLKSKNPNVKIVAVEPSASAVLSGKPAGPHKIQGIGAGFIPETLDMSVVDTVMPIENDEAYEYARKVAKTDGVLVGISSGAALCAAVKLAKQGDMQGKNIVVILPDTGERYLSTDLF